MNAPRWLLLNGKISDLLENSTPAQFWQSQTAMRLLKYQPQVSRLGMHGFPRKNNWAQRRRFISRKRWTHKQSLYEVDIRITIRHKGATKMKLEIEVQESEIKSAIERHVRSTIADKVNAWGSAKYVKDAVDAAWTKAVQDIIKEVTADHVAIRAQVEAAMVRKLTAQLTTAMKKQAS